MDKSHEGAGRIGRRRMLQVLGAGIGAASGLTILGCGKSGGGAAPAGACMDKVAVDETARTLRTNLKYKEKSDTPDKKCSLCAQYEAGKFGECGGCKLFAGGVNPEGSCLSFAPKPGAPGAPAPGAPAPAGEPAKAPG